MLDRYSFTGFPPEAVRFYRQLAAHNERDWFAAHKAVYERQVLEPAQAFVVALGARLRRLSPTLRFDPRPGGSGSIFRIHRDTRFSKDKTPYKTHLGIFFWEGERKWGPGFYFHLEPPRLQLYVGKYVFDREALAAWRAAVAGRELGEPLAALLRRLQRRGYTLGGQHYKRVPAGLAADHPRADLLKHNAVWLCADEPLPDVLHAPRLVDHCFAHFKAMSPLHVWLREVMPNSGP